MINRVLFMIDRHSAKLNTYLLNAQESRKVINVDAIELININA
jgi:hypothetical protein